MNRLAEYVENARRSWNAGDLEGYLALYDPTIRLHGYGPEPFGKEQVAQFYRMIWATLAQAGKPNPDLAFHEVLCDGDLYTCRFTMSGVHQGPFMGVAASGKAYALAGITIMRFRPGGATVVERHASADMLGLLVQIGAIPPPA